LLQRLANLGAPIAVAGLHERLGLPVPAPGEAMVQGIKK
jgi:hypothetical protein